MDMEGVYAVYGTHTHMFTCAQVHRYIGTRVREHACTQANVVSMLRDTVSRLADLPDQAHAAALQVPASFPRAIKVV